MSKLALHGGTPVRSKPFPRYNTIGDEEKKAVTEVLDSGVLSQFLGTWSPNFYGGPRVQKMEKEWAEYFKVKHAISVNSATSGLYAAVGAAGIGPGDEVIVSPYTMTASATGALVYQAVPVFADISPETFCLDPKSIRERITPRTRAIVVVDLFGHPAEMDEIMAIAKEHNLIVIEDAAQAPGAMYKGRFAGTLGHMGVYSLNYHKHIHCGEGGIVVTDDDELAERLRLIRNHGEVIVGPKGTSNIINMVGYNYRMTEIEAAITSEQLKKLDKLVAPRVELAHQLTEGLRKFPGLTPPVVKESCTHAYYMYPIRYSAAKTGITRKKFHEAMVAEGIPVTAGYVRPIYLEPIYQRQIAFGEGGYPFSHPAYKGKPNYNKGICPVTERMHEEELVLTHMLHAGVTKDEIKDFIAAVEKVLDHASELQ